MTVTASQLYEVCERTWPPASASLHKGWALRDGAGGGKRVSAATCADPSARIEDAENAMRKAGFAPLFMLREGEHDLDARLDQRGYSVIDPVNLYVCDINALTDIPIPPVTAFTLWEPLAIMTEIWAAGGIGPERLDIMHRAQTKTGILSRFRDKPAGVAFAGIHDGICMVHAVEVLPHQRRQGVAVWMMRKAAFWARDNGAKSMSVLCTKANTGANALYVSLGMQVVGDYHYRIKEA